MQIRIASVMAGNQDTALHFYTTVFGFVKSKDIPMGPTFRRFTVTAPEGVELLLEPVGQPKLTKELSSPLASPPRPSSPTTSNPNTAV